MSDDGEHVASNDTDVDHVDNTTTVWNNAKDIPGANPHLRLSSCIHLHQKVGT